MAFFPAPELESCSLVNSTWEAEALIHLVARSPIDLRLSAVNDPADLASISALSLKHVKILTLYDCYRERDILLTKCELLRSIDYFKSVTTLEIEFLVDNSMHVECHVAKLFESFLNLKSLKLHLAPRPKWENLASEEDWKDLFPDKLMVPGKLRNLTVKMCVELIAFIY